MPTRRTPAVKVISTVSETLNFDGSIAVGDAMLLVVEQVSAAGVPTTPSGWTLRGSATHGSRAGYAYTKIRASGETSITLARGTAGAGRMAVTGIAGVKSDPSTWVFGTAKGRSASPADSSTTTTALGITTTAPNTLVIGIFGEATSASEATGFVPSVTNSTPYSFAGQVSSGDIESIFLTYKEMVTAGDTGSMVATYPNVQSSNAWAMMIGFPSVETDTGTPTPVTQLAGQVADGNGGLIPVGLVAWANNDQGTPAEIALDKIEYVHSGTPIPDLQKLTRVWTMGHRGGSADYQEHSLRGYFECAINHIDVMEVSVAITSDGYFICAHDGTADRTSSAVAGQNWRFDQHTLAEVRALTQDLPNRGDSRFTTAPYMTLQEVFDKFGATHSFMIDPKEVSTANRPALYALIQTLPNYRIKVMGKFYSTGTAIADEFHAIGCLTWGYSYTADLGALEPLSSSPDGTEAGRRFIVRTDASSTKATEPKWDVLGLEHGADARAWAAMLVIAGNKKVVAHIVTTLAQADAAVAKGAKALQVAGIRSVMAGY